MNRADIIENCILNYPICEYAFDNVDKIPFSERTVEVCKTDCELYGKSWACPPYCGSAADLMQRVRSYSDFCLFSTIGIMEHIRSKKEMMQVKREHERITRSIKDELVNQIPDLYVLSAGCMLCEKCTCPDEPCRFPDKKLYSMESHGILVTELVEEMDISLDYGDDSCAFFSLILYNDIRNEVTDESQSQ